MSLPPNTPERPTVPPDLLLADIANLTSQFEELTQVHIDNSEPPEDYQELRANNWLSPLSPNYHLLTSLKDMGHAIHLRVRPSETMTSGKLYGADHFSVFVDPTEYNTVQKAEALLLQSFGREHSVPYSALTIRLNVGDFSRTNIRPDEDVDEAYREREIAEVLPEIVTDEGAFDTQRAMALYTRAFMTQVLTDMWGVLHNGNDLKAVCQDFPYMRDDWDLYNQLRAEGYSPLLFEEMHDLVSQQLHYLQEHPELDATIGR